MTKPARPGPHCSKHKGASTNSDPHGHLWPTCAKPTPCWSSLTPFHHSLVSHFLSLSPSFTSYFCSCSLLASLAGISSHGFPFLLRGDVPQTSMSGLFSNYRPSGWGECGSSSIWASTSTSIPLTAHKGRLLLQAVLLPPVPHFSDINMWISYNHFKYQSRTHYSYPI